MLDKKVMHEAASKHSSIALFILSYLRAAFHPEIYGKKEGAAEKDVEQALQLLDKSGDALEELDINIGGDWIRAAGRVCVPWNDALHASALRAVTDTVRELRDAFQDAPPTRDGFYKCLLRVIVEENPSDLTAVLEQEYAAVQAALEYATETTRTQEAEHALYSLRRSTEIWEIRFESEEGKFPVNGNKFLGLLAQLLEAPRKSFSVAELNGDSERMITADSLLGGERIVDSEGDRKIEKRIEEIEEIARTTGGSEALENELAKLIQERESYKGGKRIPTATGKAFHNINTQKNSFIKKIKSTMPLLAAYLANNIQSFSDTYSFSYLPPQGQSAWKIEKN